MCVIDNFLPARRSFLGKIDLLSISFEYSYPFPFVRAEIPPMYE